MTATLSLAYANATGRAILAVAALLTGAAGPLTAQTTPVVPFDPPARAAGAWRTLRTNHFSFHYRSEFEEWTLNVAARMEAVRDAVRSYVGYAPDRRVTVLVDDPRNEPNGNAIPWLDKPQIQLFPVPPSPRAFAQMRDWGELLAVHEFGHIAHLARPARGARRLQRFVPLRGVVGPLGERLPRWAKEGYATVIEGALTGSGRPNSAMRAAILRQFAADGLLPTYAAIDATSGFLGGSFAYLMGSAYLEHLAELHGDSTLPQLWRRLSAATARSFPVAFEQTFGVRPEDAYAKYVAQLTASAIAMERALDRAGRVEGDLEVKGNGALGDPAVSPDGTKLAITVPGAGTAAGRVVVWPASPTPAAERDSARRAAADRLLKRDSLDVAPVETPPRGKRVLASLGPAHGFGYRNPRFMPDNERLLVIRSAVRPDGSLLPDLFVWNSRTGGVRRVTRGAAVREADPFPDGERAAGLRCWAGQCDVVIIGLRTGEVRTLRSGSPLVQYARPRVSPDGLRIAVSELRAGRWRPVLIDVSTGMATPIGPADGANRYDLAWTRDGSGIFAVTDASGVPNIERLDIGTGAAIPLTRVFGAATAPEPLAADSGLFFLSLTSRGYDLRRLNRADAGGVSGVQPAELIDVTMGAVATQPGFSTPGFDSAAVRGPRRYGFGPQRLAWLPFAGASPGGTFAGVAVFGSDPNERLSWVLQHAWRADEPANSGSSARAVLRLPVFEVDAEFVRARVFEERWTGAAVSLGYVRADPLGLVGLRAGLGRHGQTTGGTTTADREHAWGAVQRTLDLSLGPARLAVDVRAQASRTTVDSRSGTRITGEHRIGVFALTVGRAGGGLTVETAGGALADARRGAPFVLGGLGLRTINPALAPQSVAVPWLEPASLSGATFTQHVVRLAVPAVQPFGWAVRTDAGRWHRAAGIEARLEQHANGFARLPGISATAGAAWLFDPPNADRVRAWAALSFRP